MSSNLFLPFVMRGVELPNRVVVSPMCQYSALDGVPSDWHIIHLGSYSASGAGLIFIEATGVEAIGRISPGCTGLYTDEQETAFRKIIDGCKKYGTAKIGLQLAHAGRKASTGLAWEGGLPLSKKEGGWDTIGPSAIPFNKNWHKPKSMDRDDMDRVRASFVSATERARVLGVDVIELHMAHGYLLSEFLSPIANRRNDKYGGSIENRIRYPLEVFSAVRDVWPVEKALGVRISATDWDDRGWTPDDSVIFALSLKDLGCDFVTCSSGGNTAERPPVGNMEQGYQVPLAAKLRSEADIPTIAIGMIRDPKYAEAVVTSGKADLVAIARGFLYEPGWVHRAAKELGGSVSYPKQYTRAKPEFWPNAFTEVN